MAEFVQMWGSKVFFFGIFNPALVSANWLIVGLGTGGLDS